MDRGGGRVQTVLRYFVIFSIGLAVFQDVRGVMAAPQSVEQSQQSSEKHSSIPQEDFNNRPLSYLNQHSYLTCTKRKREVIHRQTKLRLLINCNGDCSVLWQLRIRKGFQGIQRPNGTYAP